MIFTQLYSSSSGNLYTVTATNGKRLLIECGVTWAKLQEALSYNLTNIVAAFCTHEHKDHSKAVRYVIKAGIDVYLSNGTMQGMPDVSFDICHMRKVKSIKNHDLLRFADFEVYCFDVHHDAKEPLGFVIREKETGEFLLFATDTSHITQRFPYPFSIIAIECSYSKEILQHRVDTKDINETIAKRLLTSHMEKQNTMAYLTEHCDLSKCHQINLLHLSGDNIDKAQTQIDFEQKFFIETKILGCN